MLERMKGFLPFIALGLLAAPAAAAWQSTPASDFSVPPFPSPGSADYVSDFSTLLSVQASRTAAQCALAGTMTVPDFDSFFEGSGLLSSTEMSAAAPLMAQVDKTVGKIVTVFKKQYDRPRPYDENPQVKPCIPEPGGNLSYPSEHATIGAVEACVLGRIFPDRAASLADYGGEIGELRVIGGVHHPSDVAAGQTLGAAICAELLQQSDFSRALAQVRAGL
jgi:acid phosphatase (class A)